MFGLLAVIVGIVHARPAVQYRHNQTLLPDILRWVSNSDQTKACAARDFSASALSLSAHLLAMAALPPRADMCSATRDVRFGPIADISMPWCFYIVPSVIIANCNGRHL